MTDPSHAKSTVHARFLRRRLLHGVTTLVMAMTADLSGLGPVLADTSGAGARRPNVVLILADDLGYGDVGCYNPRRGKIPTPNIDRLAAQGMRFTDGHSSSGVCSPSRYALLTGRYHWRTKLQAGIVGVFGSPLIAPDRLTIAGSAKQQGYRTACIGKWHLGWTWPIGAAPRERFAPTRGSSTAATDEHRRAWHDAFSQPIADGPTTRGFDFYFGTDVPNWPPYCFIENDRTLGIPTEFLPSSLLAGHQASLQGPALKHWKLEPILPTLAERATQFIARHAQAKQPFLLYLPLTSPHTPLAVNDEWRGRSGLNPFADFVMETDAVVGRVLEALETAGIADDTFVLFTADNGSAPYVGAKELEARGHFPSGPLRGYKADVWEGGHRVPFIVRMPKVVEPGTVCDRLVHQADLMATLADIWDVKLPDDAGEDSFSLWPLLRGDDRPTRNTAVSCASSGVPGVRLGDWKYVPEHSAGGGRGTAAPTSVPQQLYDLAADLGETNNLAATMPEKVAEMRALLERLIVEGRSTPGPRQANDVEVVRYPRTAQAKKPRQGD